jgi:hypothetical protein
MLMSVGSFQALPKIEMPAGKPRTWPIGTVLFG